MLILEELTKRFSSGLLAVDRVSLQVQAGEVYGLLGPNGAGKTTTLRMVLGLIPPTSGQASIDGLSVAKHPMLFKRNIGLVSASAGLYPWHTPREIFHYFADAFGVAPDVKFDRINHLADVMELDSFIDQRCATLSTGQKQRVNLVRALIHDPAVVLLDEPTLGLDVVGASTVFNYVQWLRQMQKVVIVTTHQLDEAERLCDRFGLLHRGKLVLEGTLDQLRQQTGCSGLVEIFLQLLRHMEPQLTTDPLRESR